jgi:tetratricopeptide (TPR) repeat protein
MDPNHNNRSITLLVCALLGAVTLAAFWPVIHYGFVTADDPVYVLENPAVRAGLTWKGIVWAFTTQYAGNWHPLTWLSHMLDVQLFGLNAGGHHLTSLLLHVANTVLLFWVLKRVTGTLWRSVFVAALFGVHPLHVESVAWVAERKDVLSTFFFLLTLLTYAFYVKGSGASAQAPVTARKESAIVAATVDGQNSGSESGTRMFWHWAALLCFALGLMCKPMLVTLPFVLLLLDYWPWERFKVRTVAALVREKLGFFALSAASCIITFVVQRNAQAVVALGYLSPHTRGLNALTAYFLYLKKTVWPRDLAVFYPYSYSPSLELVAASLLVMVGISIVAFRNRRQHPWFAVGWLWYLGTLVPVIGIVQVGSQSMADRYTYIPLIGIFLLVTWGAVELATHWQVRKMVLAAAGWLVVGACAGLTFGQVRYWENSETLFRHALAVTTDNAVAHYLLGGILAKQGKIKEAETNLVEAVRLNPNYAPAYSDLGDILVAEGKIEEGIKYIRAAIAIKPDYAHGHYNLGWALALQGKLEEAVAEYRIALQLDPESPKSLNYRDDLAVILAKLGRTAEAAVQFQQVLKLNPADAPAHWRYGMLLARTGKLNEAIAHLQESVRLEPNLQAQQDLAFLLRTAGQPQAAAKVYREMLRVKPDSLQALNNLAWILAVNPSDAVRNGPEAVRLAERACQLTGSREPLFLGTLSAAYAEAGRFEDAIRIAGKANDLAVAAGNQALAAQIQQLLNLYRAGKPFHENAPMNTTPAGH